MITHIVLLKTKPHYIYCTGEEDAIETAKRQMNGDVIGIVCESETFGLRVMEIVNNPSLAPIQPIAVPKYVKVDDNTLEEVPEENEDRPAELDAIINSGLED